MLWSALDYVATRATLYTTLTFNIGAWATTSRDWYNYIDQNVILGAIPFSFLTEKLVSEEKVGAVISLNMPYERQYITTTTEQWHDLGVEHFKIDIPDFVSTPSLEHMWQGINLIKSKEQAGLKTYVHCKAGRSRSATLVAAYIIDRYDKSVEESMQFVREQRPHVKFTELQIRTLAEFYYSYKQGEDDSCVMVERSDLDD